MKKIKAAVKRFLDTKIGKKTLSISDIERTNTYVSFDIFDTLIIRNLREPTDLFHLIEKEQGIPDFYSKRINAEREARRKTQGEVTLKEIYGCYPGLTSEQVEKYCRIELDAELKVCAPNNSVTEFYRECAKRKKIILVSDMYLSSEMIGKLLNKCGFVQYDRIYVSCEMNATKRSGKLYDIVLKDLGVSVDKIVHVGNDFLTDYHRAKRRGIKAIKVRTTRRKTLVFDE